MTFFVLTVLSDIPFFKNLEGSLGPASPLRDENLPSALSRTAAVPETLPLPSSQPTSRPTSRDGGLLTPKCE